MKSLDWLPMTGHLDNRSIPSEMPPQSYRRLLNVWIPAANKLARSFGWEKLFSKVTGYNNEDFHDQLLALQTYYDVLDDSVAPEDILSLPNAACDVVLNTRTIGRQPVTLLHSFVSTIGSRTLLLGTESRIAALNEKNGNWRLLADGLGEGIDDGTCPRRRFYVSTNLDTAIFVNDYNQVLYWIYGSGPNGCDQQSVRPIPEMALIGVSSAAVTWTWQYTSFIANVVANGKRHPNRIIWSNYQDPLSWDPAKPETTASSVDLDYGETVLGGAPLGDYFYIFTDKGVWQLSVDKGGFFVWDKRYYHKNGDSCLYYKNTLVTSGKEIYYFGRDGFYSFSQYRPAPERLDGPHLATGLIFHESRSGTISPEWCDNHVAGFNPRTKELLFSWVPEGSETGFPTSTFVHNVAYNGSSELDHGFTAFCSHQSDPSGTLRDYLLEICACTIAGLISNGMGFIKEGLPLTLEVEDCPEFDSLYTNVAIAVDGTDLEDPNAAVDENALCLALGSIKDLCGGCPSDYTFIGACAVDWCLKQFTAVYSRERCTNPTAVGTTGANGYTSAVGTYVNDGYTTQLLSMAINFRDNRDDKTLRRIELEGIAEPQDEPSTLTLSIGQSHQVVDPLNGQLCGIIWHPQDDKFLECQSVSVTQHGLDSSRPNETLEWPLFYQSLYFYFDFQITGTGGGFEMSRITMDIDAAPKAGPMR